VGQANGQLVVQEAGTEQHLARHGLSTEVQNVPQGDASLFRAVGEAGLVNL
jgi:hypothetical protein